MRLCAVGPGQGPGRRDVDGDADQRDREDQPRPHGRRLEQPADALVGDERREDQEGHAIGLGREDLDSLEAVGHRPLRRPQGQPGRDEREADRRGVGQHVGRVGEQRQRMGDQADDHLDRHEADDQAQGDAELGRVGVGRDAVRVPGVAGVGVAGVGVAGVGATAPVGVPGVIVVRPGVPAVIGHVHTRLPAAAGGIAASSSGASGHRNVGDRRLGRPGGDDRLSSPPAER